MKRIREKLDRKSLVKDRRIHHAFERELEAILTFNDAFDRLTKGMKDFESHLTEAHKKNEFLDVKLARELFVTAAALLRICQKEPYAEHVPFSLAAISYFLNPQDGHHDQEDIDGYEDDKQVLVMVIQQFKLESNIEFEIKEMKKNQENKSA